MITHLTLTVHGEFAGSLPRWFIDRLEAASSVELVFDNAWGGDLQEALAAAELLLDSGKLKCCTVVSDAASAAADRFGLLPCPRYMKSSARLRLHKATLAMVADADALRKGADLLEKLGRAVIDALVHRTGQPRETVELWHRPGEDAIFTAEGAKHFSLCDEIIP